MTPLNREAEALVRLRDGGPLTLDRENEVAENRLGVVDLAIVHTLERKLLVTKSGGTFILTVAGTRLAATFSKA